MELVGNVNNYEWGKTGKSSKVAQLASANDSVFEADESKPYSELWMGDHISGPSFIKSSGQSLLEFTKANSKEIGGMKSLPFLLKILSIRKALSLQVHPNKAEAERLHGERPDIYKDPNHKPELAIALTPFLALCGFRPYSEIAQVLRDYPEIRELAGGSPEFESSPSEANLRKTFEVVMRASQGDLEKCVRKLRDRFAAQPANLYEKTFLRLDEDFPNDVGCVTLFFLNLVQLAPGEAINLEANLPHAYLEGDCVECMACSDNVVRAGLTPKFKDVDTLVRMLDYSGKSQSEVKYQPRVFEELRNTRAFIPKVKDFAVLEIRVPAGEDSHVIRNRQYGSILLVLEGEGTLNGTPLRPGSILFLPGSLSDSELALKLQANAPFVAYQAMYNDFE